MADLEQRAVALGSDKVAEFVEQPHTEMKMAHTGSAESVGLAHKDWLEEVVCFRLEVAEQCEMAEVVIAVVVELVKAHICCLAEALLEEHYKAKDLEGL